MLPKRAREGTRVRVSDEGDGHRSSSARNSRRAAGAAGIDGAIAKPCFDFRNGNCNRGNACQYSHTQEAQGRQTQRNTQRHTGGGERRNDRSQEGHGQQPTSHDASGYRSNGGNGGGGGGTYYTQHLSGAEVEAGVAAGRLFVGTLYVNPRKNVEAYMRCSTFNIDLRIDDDKARNRSLHGDRVSVSLSPLSLSLSLSLSAPPIPLANPTTLSTYY
jgi:hypothetical protein